jgi:undecaprenyl-diphosphatase
LDWIEAVVMGIIQGLTEFLPVSSSGHLVLGQFLAGLQAPEMLFNISVHGGTMLAVLVVFHRDLLGLISALGRIPAAMRTQEGLSTLVMDRSEARLLLMIGVGSVPTAIMGLLLAQVAEELFGTIRLVGFALLITGLFLWFTRRLSTEGRPLNKMRWQDALIIGIAQGVAIIPGISRSGATIAAALYLGLDRELSGRFSFLLSIPAIVGALVLGLNGDLFSTQLPAVVILAGSVSAAGIGYLALTFLLRIVKRGQLHHFAPYCWLVGAAALVVSLL